MLFSSRRKNISKHVTATSLVASMMLVAFTGNSYASAVTLSNETETDSYAWVELTEEEWEESRARPGAPELRPIEDYLDETSEGPDASENSGHEENFELLSATDEQIEQLKTQCAEQGEINSNIGWIKDRFHSCVHREQMATLMSNIGPLPISKGELFYDMWLLGFTYRGTRQVDYVVIVDNVFAAPAIGEDPTSWKITHSFEPSISTDKLTVPADTERSATLLELAASPQWALTYTAPTDGPKYEQGDLQIVSPQIIMSTEVSSPGAASYNQAQSAVSNVRFDYAGNIGNHEQGTVFTDARVTYSLSLSDPAVRESALHIRDALDYPERTFPSWLGKTVPGGKEEPLHRLINRARQDDNRDTAVENCENVWGDYNGTLLNCDEYPFSSTYEGASLGNMRYSSRLIEARDNQLAGARLGGMYARNRMLDGDAFYVQITP
ncbi:NucA/NucB deoxyribonuclease domain-containing protein [Nocardiopsis sp. TNDT3]|uniref:NucA/NucB deoxyribonuclease domain-containing protein n=1 Tax=Nocardiopsis sp. TNDT3 TaxID=2249354 RepID=UPI00130046FC|nr:NucA/NucB deoxyribonuclease domain-containing protein [Nocardiopsis sp. TNDT3]